MAAIISTASAIIFLAESTEEKIEVVTNYWQTSTIEGLQRLPMSEGIIPYTLSVIIRKPVQEISIRFGVLRNRTLDVNYTGWESLSLRERAIKVGGLDYHRAMPRVQFLHLGPEGSADNRMILPIALIEMEGDVLL